MENQDLEQIQYVCLIKILDYITAVAFFILTKYSLLPGTTQLLLHRKGLPLKNFNSRTPASSCFRLRCLNMLMNSGSFVEITILKEL